MRPHISLRDLASGLIFVAIGVGFAVASSGYEMGRAIRMGPGYFPLILSIAMIVLGAAIIVKGLRSTSPEEPLGVVPWTGLVLVLGSIIFFGATVRGLGLGPSLAAVLFATALASRSNTLVSAAILAVAMTAFCILIFIYGLGVALPLVGPWLR